MDNSKNRKPLHDGGSTVKELTDRGVDGELAKRIKIAQKVHPGSRRIPTYRRRRSDLHQHN